MKKLVGRGPLSIVTSPKAHLRELAGFDVVQHATGWKATRQAGILVDSISLEAAIAPEDVEAMDPDAEVEWTVTVRSVPDRSSFGGPTAAGSTLVSGAVAFWVTYESLESLPRKPSLHFALATLLLAGTFAVMLTVLYFAVATISKKLVARMEQRPTRAMSSRADRLAALVEGTPLFGLAPTSAEAPRS